MCSAGGPPGQVWKPLSYRSRTTTSFLENIWHKVNQVISKFRDVRYDQFVYCLNDVLYPIIWLV